MLGNQNVGADRKTEMNARLGHCDGMTLVETLVAVLIFGIAIGGLAMLIVSAKQTSDRARDHYVAVNIGKNRLERIRNAGTDQIYLFDESFSIVNVSGNGDPDGDFRRTTVCSQVRTNLHEITVTVDIRNKVSRQFDGGVEVLQTYMADFVTVEE